VPWTAAYVDSRGEPTCDLRSNIAAESRAKIVYERLINITDDPGIKEALGFLMTREVAHQKSFEKALYAIEPNFPPGKLPGVPSSPTSTTTCRKARATPPGHGTPASSGKNRRARESRWPSTAATVWPASSWRPRTPRCWRPWPQRTQSDPTVNPVTGVDLGAGPGAGKTTQMES
jgi:Mn-containing catalase